MKTKKNKKFYNFTEKQKRKDRSVKRDLPPAGFRKLFNDERDAKNKQILRKISMEKRSNLVSIKNV